MKVKLRLKQSQRVFKIWLNMIIEYSHRSPRQRNPPDPTNLAIAQPVTSPAPTKITPLHHRSDSGVKGRVVSRIVTTDRAVLQTTRLFGFFFRSGINKPFRPTSQDRLTHGHCFLSLALSLLPPMCPTLVTLTVRGFLLRTSHD